MALFTVKKLGKSLSTYLNVHTIHFTALSLDERASIFQGFLCHFRSAQPAWCSSLLHSTQGIDWKLSKGTLAIPRNSYLTCTVQNSGALCGEAAKGATVRCCLMQGGTHSSSGCAPANMKSRGWGARHVASPPLNLSASCQAFLPLSNFFFFFNIIGDSSRARKGNNNKKRNLLLAVGISTTTIFLSLVLRQKWWAGCVGGRNPQLGEMQDDVCVRPRGHLSSAPVWGTTWESGLRCIWAGNLALSKTIDIATDTFFFQQRGKQLQKIAKMRPGSLASGIHGLGTFRKARR